MQAFSVVEQYPFLGVVAETHASYVSMHERSLIRIYVLKQIAQHGNK